MAYKDKEKAKEYQRQYYWNKTKLKRKLNPVKNKPRVKKTAEEKSESYRKGAMKRIQNMREKYGEEGLREYFKELGRLGNQALVDKGVPVGFQAGYAKDASKLGIRARGLKSKHKKIREKYEREEREEQGK